MATKSFFQDMVTDTKEAADRLIAAFDEARLGCARYRHLQDPQGRNGSRRAGEDLELVNETIIAPLRILLKRYGEDKWLESWTHNMIVSGRIRNPS